MKNTFILLFLLLALPYTNQAQTKDSIKTIKPPEYVLELPLIDLPYQSDAAKTVDNGKTTVSSFFKGYVNPSMHQSLDLSSTLYTGTHMEIENLFKTKNDAEWKYWSAGKRAVYLLTMFTSDCVLIYAPGFDGWEHEEYHRSVLTRFHVNSFNDMNKFPIGAELVNVSHVNDADLVRFKKESPSDFVRAHAAGIEGEYLLVDKLQRNNFFYQQNLTHEFLYFLSIFNSISYVQMCSQPKQADSETDKANTNEKNIPTRDFTGLDFCAWTYDLFRPNEPYTARGTHPTGIGLNRYIKTTDLTSDELSYLEKQGRLQWLNLISPMMIGFKSIKLTNDGLYGNFSVRDFLTSFGNDISLNVYLKNPQYKFSCSLHLAQNYQQTYPAIEARLFDWPQTVGALQFYISPRVLIGTQPVNQEFKTSSSDFLGMAECKIELKSKHFIHPYIELSGKSKGWVAGNEFLNPNFSCRFGLVARFNG